ncbi:MAG: protein-disulfide reductase DsbD family protein [Magnetovibrionaceae bacterium]
MGLRLFAPLILVFGLVFGVGSADQSFAAAGPWAETENSAVRLISAATSTAGDQVELGLEFKLKPGWHIYWKAPGDAGLPPVMDWAASKNLASTDFRWPLPTRYELLGIETLGYEDHVVFPITAKLEQVDEPLNLQTRLNYLACAEVCIPYDTTLTLDLPPGDGQASKQAHLIGRFQAEVPRYGPAYGIEIESAGLRGSADEAYLDIVALKSTGEFRAPDLFVQGPEELVFTTPTVTLSEGGGRAVIRVPVHGLTYMQGDFLGRTVNLTLSDQGQAVEITKPVTESLIPLQDERPAAATETTGLSLITVLGLALLGGLILNLMPCVLPVLSIKLIGVLSHGGGDAGGVRRGFLATSAGIVFSFLVLAVALIGLKESGAAIGWGIQFQQPWFLTAMVLVIALFSLNLFGLFEIALPGKVGTAAHEAGNAGGLAGPFAQGAFATLLATPCSAPFLGTALGFAFTRGAAEILAVFSALGIGLALPYLAVAAFPKLATWLPKPGAWMVWVKRIMGLALAGTAVWLLSVFANVAGQNLALGLGAVVLVIAVLLAFRAKIGAQKAWGLVGAAGLAAFALPILLPAGSAKTGAVATHSNQVEAFAWTAFDPEAIPDLVAEGKTVYVDVTADWCITCIVNKRVVMADEAARAWLESDAVVAMQADWTKPDDAIAAYLASFGRYAIPFNAVYGPALPNGKALPELLTPTIVTEALVAAGGESAKPVAQR